MSLAGDDDDDDEEKEESAALPALAGLASIFIYSYSAFPGTGGLLAWLLSYVWKMDPTPTSSSSPFPTHEPGE